MITLPVWIDDWVYQCCGPPRRLGEMVALDLTFEGDIQAATEPDHIEVLDEGRVGIVGTVVGPVADEDNHTPGTLVTCDAVQFAIKSDAPATHVACTGHLWEIRHGWPSGRTTGELVGIRWRPARVRPTGNGGGMIEGYDAGEELASTEDWRERRDDRNWRSWALELTVNVGEAVATRPPRKWRGWSGHRVLSGGPAPLGRFHLGDGLGEGGVRVLPAEMLHRLPWHMDLSRRRSGTAAGAAQMAR